MNNRRILDVTLDEASHIYSDTNNFRYDSVTTILNNYKEKFDPHKITKDGLSLVENYVLKHGETVEYWLNEWDENRIRACRKGTAFHKIRENVHNGLLQVERPKIFQVQDVNQLIDRNPGIDYSELPNGSYRELTLFNRRYMIAGQADNTIIEDGYFDIDDDKTNGKFETVSFKPPRGSHRMMNYPLQRLMDCHLFHYTMQLSTYAWMLEQFGLKCRQLRLLHFTIFPEQEKAVLAGEEVHIEPEMYIVKYEKDLVEKMINHYTTVIRKRK